MTLEREYLRKKTTAEEAVKCIYSGDWLDFGFCTCTPDKLDQALAARADELEDVNIRGALLTKKLAIFDVPEPQRHFTWNSWHMSGIERAYVKQGYAYYAPMRFSELPSYYSDHIERVDVAMIQVCPMDKHGYFNFGPSASHLYEVCMKAKVVIVEVNQNMPKCFGKFQEGIHISQVDMIVEGDNPEVGTIATSSPKMVDEKVAGLIVEQIPDGACLQLGIGAMPNAVGMMIARSELKNLGVHTEMFVDGFVDMYEAGKITGNQKNIDFGRMTYAFGAGSRRLYDFLDENPACMVAPVGYTNAINVIQQLDNFISINNAIDIDLFGQVNAESAGIRHISGAGGQQDFVLGAYLSKGGKSFICCSSTFKTKDGELRSRIVPTLNEGSIVTDTRTNTHYVVTEFGMVNLKGLSTWQRAEALISIAHPQFRDELIQQADEMHIWRHSNKII